MIVSLRLLVGKVLRGAVTIWIVVSLTFLANHLLPSDPARAIAGPQARAQDVEHIRQQLGLDKPIAVQYGRFARRLVHLRASSTDPLETHTSCTSLGVVHLDLGMSYQQRRPVLAILGERLPRTLWLAVVATLLQTMMGVGVGLLAAMKPRSPWDHATSFATLVGISAPTFLVGVIFQYVFAYKLRWLPLDGYGQTMSEHVAAVILPGLTLGAFGAASYTRLVRDEMGTVLSQDYIRTARAKGASTWRVVRVHGLRNALMPLMTMVGLDLGALLGGAIVTEKLFRWPGLGQLSVEAVFDRDQPVIMGTVIIGSAAVVVCNLLVDASYLVLDPRVRSPLR